MRKFSLLFVLLLSLAVARAQPFPQNSVTVNITPSGTIPGMLVFTNTTSTNIVGPTGSTNIVGGFTNVLGLSTVHGATSQELLSLLSIVLNFRGVNRWNASQANDGVKDLERSVKFNPENMVAKSNLAIMYNLLGIRCADSDEFSRAADYFISSLKLVPDDKTVLNNLKKANSEKHREYLAYLQLPRGR